MKRIILFFFLFVLGYSVHAQILPKLEAGVKAGLNLSKLNTENFLDSENKAGYYGGLWLRVGVAGLHFQPELIYSNKKTNLVNNKTKELNEVTYKSLDVPLLIGTKIGAVGIGLRLNTGPLFSFKIAEDQNFNQAASSVIGMSSTMFNAKNANMAWQFGTGLDLKSLSIDLRYELGLSKLNKSGYPDAKLNLFQFGLGYKF